MDERDFILDDDGEMVIRDGAFLTGHSLTQDVALLLMTNQGELRHDPLAGCNLRRRVNARISQSQMERVLRVQMERDGKNWNAIRDGVKIKGHG